MAKCLVYESYCQQHNFIHGAEANELRERLESLENKLDDDTQAVEVIDMVKHILESVDARDSLAYIEVLTKRAAEDEKESESGYEWEK